LSTIAAIATPPGAGGVGIVRLSGPQAGEILERLVGAGVLKEARRLVRAVVCDPSTGERLDEVLAVFMKAPGTYTGEDVAEIHGHGGALNLARILGATVALGARVAEPGEFTRRAFRHGRLDLTRAEAVAEVIAAASDRALRAAQNQLAGALGQRVSALRARAIALLAEVEGSIDFPEEDLDFLAPGEIGKRAAEIAAHAGELAASYRVGRALREGLEVALVGAPNAGKSSLLNALAGEERALVATEPGTTRDYVEARVTWEGIAVTLIDTAGDRQPESEVERRGVELGRARARRADIILRVLDATTGGAANEGEVAVWNKIDLAPAPEGATGVSALTGEGLEDLRRFVVATALGGAGDADDGDIVTSERQRGLLAGAAEAATRAAEAARAGQPAEIVAVDVRTAARELGLVTGEEVGEQMLDLLFARFCIGK
jgi:tRNA modification GTPase